MSQEEQPGPARFPDGFLWGVATSAYQIEGGAQADGRGESIWDRFCRTPGKVERGETGDVACDHYVRWREDVALMKGLGLKAYRFSIAWPRVLPQGRGALNQAGLDFYSRLVDELLGAGISPCATLYHWDLPQPLQDAGGWPSRATAHAFADYAEAVGRRLGDRVPRWITINEPWCASLLSHEQGRHAPGWKDWPAALSASHHLLLAHGLALQALRAHSGAEVGIALNLTPADPLSDELADRDACRQFDGYFNRWFLDPLFGRGYPGDMLGDYARSGRLPRDWAERVLPGDLEIIAAPADFLGVNYYTRAVVRATGSGDQRQPEVLPPAPGADCTEMGWEIHPQGLYDTLCRVHCEYGPARIFVTENGVSRSDAPDADGRVRDEGRLAFLRAHLRAARRALAAGVPLAGYFLWSLLDNFEWERGYAQRFGIVWVDFGSQQRVPKDSALWYGRVIAANSAEVA